MRYIDSKTLYSFQEKISLTRYNYYRGKQIHSKDWDIFEQISNGLRSRYPSFSVNKSRIVSIEHSGKETIKWLRKTGNGALLPLQIPPSIKNLKYLKTLILKQHCMDELPETIGMLENLETLILYDNGLKSLPECLGNLHSLRYLGIKEDDLTSLPETIGNLPSLEILHLEGKNLTSLPKSIINIKSLRYLNLQGDNLVKPSRNIRIIMERLQKKGIDILRF